MKSYYWLRVGRKWLAFNTRLAMRQYTGAVTIPPERWHRGPIPPKLSHAQAPHKQKKSQKITTSTEVS